MPQFFAAAGFAPVNILFVSFNPAPSIVSCSLSSSKNSKLSKSSPASSFSRTGDAQSHVPSCSPHCPDEPSASAVPANIHQLAHTSRRREGQWRRRRGGGCRQGCCCCEDDIVVCRMYLLCDHLPRERNGRNERNATLAEVIRNPMEGRGVCTAVRDRLKKERRRRVDRPTGPTDQPRRGRAPE